MHREEAGLEQTNQSDTKRVVQFILTYKTKSHMMNGAGQCDKFSPGVAQSTGNFGETVLELKYTLSG